MGGIWSAEEEAAAHSARHAELRLQLRSLGWIAGQLQEAAALSNNDSAKVADFIVLRDEVVARRLAVVDQRKKQRVDEMLLCRADPQHADKLQKELESSPDVPSARYLFTNLHHVLCKKNALPQSPVM